MHQETSVPRDIKRVDEIELQMKLSTSGPFAYLHRDAVSKARKHWMGYADQARGAAEDLIALALQKTRIVWDTVIQEATNKLATR